MLSIFCSALLFFFFFFFTLFLQGIKINFWECWASCFLQRFLQCFPIKAEFLSGVLTGNSPQWAKCFSLNSILHNLSGMLCNHFMGQTVTLHSLQGTWQTQVVKLNFSSRRSQWAMTLPSFCSPSQEPAALGDPSRWNLRFTGVCLFTSRARREAMLVSVCPRPTPPLPPSPVWGLSVCVSISDTSPGLIPSLGDGANLSGETAD